MCLNLLSYSFHMRERTVTNENTWGGFHLSGKGFQTLCNLFNSELILSLKKTRQSRKHGISQQLIWLHANKVHPEFVRKHYSQIKDKTTWTQLFISLQNIQWIQWTTACKKGKTPSTGFVTINIFQPWALNLKPKNQTISAVWICICKFFF